MRVTVFGGKGLLGSHLVPRLENAGHEICIASRSARGEGEARADIATGEGLAEAVEGSDIVVHLASDARQPTKTDVAGTRNLLEILGSQHLIYMSIVGVDRHPFAYYRAKRQAEVMIDTSGVPNSILRATQFHDFVAYFIGAACKPPVALIPKRFVFQPIDTSEVATYLAELVETRAPGLQPDLAGPKVHTAEHLARTLMTSIGRERPIINLPVPGKAARAFKQGAHTNPDRAVGTTTWEEFLSAREEPGNR